MPAATNVFLRWRAAFLGGREFVIFASLVRTYARRKIETPRLGKLAGYRMLAFRLAASLPRCRVRRGRRVCESQPAAAAERHGAIFTSLGFKNRCRCWSARCRPRRLRIVGRLGESFVSMGISFWEANQREEAIRLTYHGISLVMQGVKDRVINQDALAVPYSNLAFMHRELGDVKQAESYAQMASRVDDSRRE